MVRNGYEILFFSCPPLLSENPQQLGGGFELWPYVVDLVAKQAMKEVAYHHHSRSFFNHLFLVPKSDGTKRQILDLKALNLFVRRGGGAKFTMETSASASIQNVIDAFVHVLLAEKSRRDTRFEMEGRIFQSLTYHDPPFLS